MVDLKALVKQMNSLGITYLKTADVELSIVLKPKQKRQKRIRNPMAESPTIQPKGFGGYTDDEILEWSSAAIGDNRAQDNS